MASSGTYAFSLSNGEAVLQAFARIGIRRAALTQEHLLDARNETNLMFAEWANDGPDLWAVDSIAIPLIAGTATYAVDPATVMILDAYLSTTDADRTLSPVSRSEYASYPDKTMTGTPTVFWFDRLIAPSVTVWPIPDASSTYTLNFFRSRMIQDANLPAGETPEVPNRWLDALVWCLAERLAWIYAPDRLQVLAPRAMLAYQKASTQDTENAPMTIGPDLSTYYR